MKLLKYYLICLNLLTEICKNNDSCCFWKKLGLSKISCFVDFEIIIVQHLSLIFTTRNTSLSYFCPPWVDIHAIFMFRNDPRVH